MLKYLAVAIVLLAGPAGAQVPGEEAKACVLHGGPKVPGYDTKGWPDEARRFKDDDQNVSRQDDKLRLKLEGGKTVELADCPFGDSAYSYIYERYDAAGRFYVVRKPQNEDFSYLLVMKETGRQFMVYGTPIWASDKSRFLTVACSMLPPRAELTISAPAGDSFTTEAAFPLPCDRESCSARWDHPSWVSVACTPHDGSGKKGTEFVVMRGSDGVWKKFGR